MIDLLLLLALLLLVGALATLANYYRWQRDRYRARWQQERRNAITWGRRYFQSQTREL